MRVQPARALYLLLTLNLVVAGVCPLAPRAMQAPVPRGQCRHEQAPAQSPHSCCISVHHQPALVRAFAASCHAALVGDTVIQSPLPPTRNFVVTTVVIAASPPPPASVLRI